MIVSKAKTLAFSLRAFIALRYSFQDHWVRSKALVIRGEHSSLLMTMQNTLHFTLNTDKTAGRGQMLATERINNGIRRVAQCHVPGALPRLCAKHRRLCTFHFPPFLASTAPLRLNLRSSHPLWCGIISVLSFSLFRTHFINLGTIIDPCDTLWTLRNIAVFFSPCRPVSVCVCRD